MSRCRSRAAGDARIARDMLQEAERAHVKVSVLAVGEWLLAHPFIAHRILHGGHELGNQTYSHPADLARLSPDAAYEEIARCAAVLRKLTGSPGTWFRPSGTPHANRMILTAAGRAGYARCLSYDVDTTDWTDPGAPHIVAAVDKVQHGSVISLHLGHAGTLAALPQILDHLRERGPDPGDGRADVRPGLTVPSPAFTRPGAWPGMSPPRVVVWCCLRPGCDGYVRSGARRGGGSACSASAAHPAAPARGPCAPSSRC